MVFQASLLAAKENNMKHFTAVAPGWTYIRSPSRHASGFVAVARPKTKLPSRFSEHSPKIWNGSPPGSKNIR